jgi:hypothetical protein
VTHLGQKIVAFFSDPSIEQIARETKFVQRRSRLTGLIFLKSLVMGFLEKPQGSLSHLAQVCADGDVTVSAQGIDERINEHSVAFFEAVFSQAINRFQNQCPLVLPILQMFSAIRIVDSSIMSLPAAMQERYPGCGGSGPLASLKIQLVFDFLVGNFQQICLQAGRSSDQAYWDYLKVVQLGSLTLVDLGYFCLDAFRAIAEAQAYFLSRYLYPTALLTLEGQRIDVVIWLNRESQNRIDLPVLLGSRQRLPCRVIAVRAPTAAVADRRRKAIEKARQHHKVLTQAYLDLLAWSLFVTNVPAQRLSLDQVILLYRIRWQIELLFKVWKSYAGLNAIGPWRSARVLTELYAKLIGCVLFQFLIQPVRIPDQVWANRELSTIQARLTLSHFAVRLNLSLCNLASFCLILQQMLAYFARFALKQKRIKHPNICQRLASALA